VFREGRRFHSPWAVLHARRRSTQEELPAGPRLAIVAGRKFHTAVERNRARRVLRETTRMLLREAADSWDLVLVARGDLLREPYEARLANLADLFLRAGVLREGVASAT
jgi:ribonuclease P protein component